MSEFYANNKLKMYCREKNYSFNNYAHLKILKSE